ncbi:hypothetical protein ElyMa_000982300 [Elysia marginata]|uniref:Uncharacterized protein n=1 Tax=Elysia marginata TaxID=1093978 RepID=A0AAV4HFH4_9GAST|nr:hypothetical protein ElyMa_000982300 [Elysia marginata]
MQRLRLPGLRLSGYVRCVRPNDYLCPRADTSRYADVTTTDCVTDLGREHTAPGPYPAQRRGKIEQLLYSGPINHRLIILAVRIRE